jgi:hypothetical protein
LLGRRDGEPACEFCREFLRGKYVFVFILVRNFFLPELPPRERLVQNLKQVVTMARERLAGAGRV